jgi:hypothetical protein
MIMTNKDTSAIESDKLIVFNPKYRNNKNKRITILRVVIDNEYTRVDFLYWSLKNNNMGKWIQIEKDTYIRALNSDQKLKLIKAENIGVSPNKRFFKTKLNLLNFTLYFPPLPKDMVAFDLIEKDTTNENYFNFHKINLKVAPKKFYGSKN